MGVALTCTGCGAAAVSSLFYRGPEAHACRFCSAPFELADPARDRREGGDRRLGGDDFERAEWRSGEERRRYT